MQIIYNVYEKFTKNPKNPTFNYNVYGKDPERWQTEAESHNYRLF